MTNIHLIPAFRRHPPQDKERLASIVAECDDKKIPMIFRIFGLEKERDELLEALENMVRAGQKQGFNDGYASEIDKARAAISKARGQS